MTGRLRRASPYLLAAVLGVSGLSHFAFPAAYASIVPRVLPARRALVYLSGLAELGCAGGLLDPRTRRLAGWASAALFVVVFPANVEMALAGHGRSTAYQAAVWARLPLQAPLVWWAVSLARGVGGTGGRGGPGTVWSGGDRVGPSGSVEPPTEESP